MSRRTLPSRRVLGATALALVTTAVPAAAAPTASWGPVVDLASSRSLSRPDVVVGPGGATTVVWRGRDGVVARTRSPEGRWGATHRLGRGTAPAAGVDRYGRVTVIWTRHLTGMGPQVMTADRDPAKGWTLTRPLSRAVPSNGSSFPGAFRPRLAVAHGGAAVVTWMWGADDSGGSRVQVRYRPLGDITWHAPVTVSPVEARTPEVAVGDGGHAVVTYTVNARLLAVRRAAGAWGPRERIGSHAMPPQVAMDASGRATVAWSAYDPAGGAFHPTAVTAVPGEDWSDPVTLDAAGTRSLPVVGTDRTGRSTVAWVRDGAVMTTSRPLDGAWSPPQTVAAPAPPVAGAPPQLAIGVARGGATLLTWTRGGAGSHVVQGAYRPAGAVWQSPRRISARGTDAAAAATHVGPRAVAAWRAYDGQGRPHVQLRFLRP